MLCTLAGKYSAANLPKGPRGSLFKQLLPGIAPLSAALAAVAASRRKTVSQVWPGELQFLYIAFAHQGWLSVMQQLLG
jgi:hypothetical protein